MGCVLENIKITGVVKCSEGRVVSVEKEFSKKLDVIGLWTRPWRMTCRGTAFSGTVRILQGL
jgi:hypothetical protein